MLPLSHRPTNDRPDYTTCVWSSSVQHGWKCGAGAITHDSGILIGRRGWEYLEVYTSEESRDAVAGDGNDEPLSFAPGQARRPSLS